jgi:hypothetical protein
MWPIPTLDSSTISKHTKIYEMKKYLILTIFIFINISNINAHINDNETKKSRLFLGGKMGLDMNFLSPKEYPEANSYYIKMFPKLGYRMNDRLSITFGSGLSLYKNYPYNYILISAHDWYQERQTTILNEYALNLSTSLLYSIRLDSKFSLFSEIELFYCQSFNKSSEVIPWYSKINYYFVNPYPSELNLTTNLGFSYIVSRNIDLIILVWQFQYGFEFRKVHSTYYWGNNTDISNISNRKMQFDILLSRPIFQIYYKF